MSWIISTVRAQKIPMADSSGEKPAVPETFDIETDEKSVPMATSHLDSVTLTIQASNAAGTAKVWARAVNDADWYELATMDISSGEPVSERFQCPIGQLQVEVLVADSAELWAQGNAANRT